MTSSSRATAMPKTIPILLACSVLAAARSSAAAPNDNAGAQAEALYAMFDKLGYAGKDFSAVIRLLAGRLDTLN